MVRDLFVEKGGITILVKLSANEEVAVRVLVTKALGDLSISDKLHDALFGEGVLKENGIIFTGMILGSFLNYVVYSRIVWREQKTTPSSAQPYNNIS